MHFQQEHHLTLSEVYVLIGCTKQNISYWSLHSYSTQAKKSIYGVIEQSARLFKLSDDEAEALANSAGLSLRYEGGNLIEALDYSGKKTVLCEKSIISNRMLRLYQHKTPTKETLLALAIALNKNCDEIHTLLCRYGYSLSESIIADVVVKWYLTNYNITDEEPIIIKINKDLFEMKLPLLMTRQF